MDFFGAQDHARRKSRWLILWFLLAVAGVIAAVYFLITFAFGATTATDLHGQTRFELWSAERLLLTVLFVGVVVGGGSAWKTVSLARGGGVTVALELGGRPVARDTTHPLERRLINIVDEMAIASGIPAPPVFVLDEESGINAFAAGTQPTEGVVAVTRGALEHLSRDELQGVIAHEFSHILNGDMRLNLRLMGVLHGILLLTLIGRVMMRARSRDKNAVPFVLMGLALVAVGYLGVFFGKLIKAAVSREREYLADASAVQFTRNPEGLAGALRRIAGIGSNIEHPRAEEASHMFFGSSARLSALMATHPPIETRIQRLAPDLVPRRHPTASTRAGQAAGAAPRPGADSPISQLTTTPTAFMASIGQPQSEHVAHTHALLASLPNDIRSAVHQSQGSMAALFALLLCRKPDVRTRQINDLQERHGEACARQTGELAAWLATQGPELRLVLLDLALPTTAEAPAEERERVLTTIDRLIQADGRTSIFEYVVRRIARSQLIRRDRLNPVRVEPARLQQDVNLVLAMLARAGSSDQAAARAAFEQAAARAPMEGHWEFDPSRLRLSVSALDEAIEHLAACRPAFRKRLVEACVVAVMHNGKISVHEAELLRAIAQSLECPVPPLLAYAGPLPAAG